MQGPHMWTGARTLTSTLACPEFFRYVQHPMMVSRPGSKVSHNRACGALQSAGAQRVLLAYYCSRFAPKALDAARGSGPTPRCTLPPGHRTAAADSTAAATPRSYEHLVKRRRSWHTPTQKLCPSPTPATPRLPRAVTVAAQAASAEADTKAGPAVVAGIPSRILLPL